MKKTFLLHEPKFNYAELKIYLKVFDQVGYLPRENMLKNLRINYRYLLNLNVF